MLYLTKIRFSGSSIFSISVHPNGLKFATAGYGTSWIFLYSFQLWSEIYFLLQLDQKIKIWNMAPCRGPDEKEPDPAVGSYFSTIVVFNLIDFLKKN